MLRASWPPGVRLLIVINEINQLDGRCQKDYPGGKAAVVMFEMVNDETEGQSHAHD